MKDTIRQTDSSAYRMFNKLWLNKAHADQTRFEGRNT